LIRRDRRLHRIVLPRNGQRRHTRRGDTRLSRTRKSLLAFLTRLRRRHTGLTRSGSTTRLLVVPVPALPALVLHTRLARRGLRPLLLRRGTRLRRRRSRRRGRLITRNGPRRRCEDGHGRCGRKR